MPCGQQIWAWFPYMVHESKNTALHIAFLYAAIGYLWIISSDLITAYIYETDLTAVFPHSFKGAIFIFATATALYLIVRRYHATISDELAETSRLNKLLRMISRFNQELIHADNETVLLERACTTIVDVGGYELAWIGYAENDERKSVRLMTGAGAHDEYVSSVDITWSDAPSGRGPTGTAIRKGMIAICTSTMADPDFEPWRELATRHGLASSAAFPLAVEGKTIGALNVYSDKKKAFAGKELEILTSLSGDLSYGITSLRRKDARVEAERAAAESALEYRRIVETSYEGIWTVDRNAFVTFANKRMASMLGYEPEEITGRRMTDFLHDRFKDVFRHNFKKKLLGVSEVCEYIFIQKNGSELHAVISASPIHDAHGAICGALNMVTDITAHKKAELALQDREEQLDTITSSAKDMIIMIDGDGRVNFWNPAAERTLGYSRDEAIGKLVSDLIIPEKYRDEHNRGLQEFRKTGEGPIIGNTVELTARRKDGTEFPMELSVSSARIGSEWSAVAIMRDITSRRAAEETLATTEAALHESERRIRVAMENIKLIAVQLDTYGNVVFANDYTLELTGWGREDIKGRSWFGNFIPQEASGEIEDYFKTVLTSDFAPYLENEIVTKTGARRLVAWNNTLLKDTDGNPVGVMSIGADITERKKAESALHYRLQVERALSEAAALFLSPSGADCGLALKIIGEAVNTDYARIFLTSADGRFMEFAHEWHAAGVPPQKEMFRGFNVADAQWWMRQIGKNEALYINDIEKMPEEAAAERETYRRLGVKSILAVPIVTRRQELIGFIEYVTTNKKREWTKDDEHALRILSGLISGNHEVTQAHLLIRKLYHAVEQGPASVVITNVAGDIEYVNPKYEEITGYSASEAIGKNPKILKSGETPPEEYKKLWETITAGKEWRGEFHNRRKNGELFWESASISPIRNEKGEITNFIAVKEDITERRKWEQSLQEANDKLRNALADLKNTQSMLIRSEKLASLGKLAAGVAHEIKNPLNIISTSIQLMMMEENFSEEGKNEFRSMLKQINRAVKITDNLQDFARKRKPEIRDIDLSSFLEKTIALVEYEMRTENIKIVKNFCPEPIHIKGDEDQLAQVFLNLIGNARDSMNEKQERAPKETGDAGWECRLTVSTQNHGDKAVVRFEDTGTGIPREILNRVLDPFFTTKPEGKGTGLGLAIAYGIIENHGGSIEVESEDGKGASIAINLLLDPEPAGVKEDSYEQFGEA